MKLKTLGVLLFMQWRESNNYLEKDPVSHELIEEYLKQEHRMCKEGIGIDDILSILDGQFYIIDNAVEGEPKDCVEYVIEKLTRIDEVVR